MKAVIIKIEEPPTMTGGHVVVGGRAIKARAVPSFGRSRLVGRSRCLIGIAILCIVLLVPWSSVPPEDLSKSEPVAVNFASDFMYGDYGRPVRQVMPGAQHSMPDIDATIDALVQAHVSSYAYLISPEGGGDPGISRRAFEALPTFAAAAGKAGINVYVYLVPPSEASVTEYAPFFWDYVAWAGAIGGVAEAHPAVKGIMIDDFGINTSRWSRHAFSFTEPYVVQMMTAARSRAPWLAFIPVLYYHDVIGERAIAAEYRSVMQAIVFPFSWATAIGIPGNTRQSNGAYQQGAAVSDAVGCHHESRCTQLRFIDTVPGSTVVPQATLSSQLTTSTSQAGTLTFRAHSDAGRQGSSINATVQVNGQVLRSVRLSPGWHEYTYRLDDQTRRQSDVGVDITFTRMPVDGSQQESIMIGSPHLEGSDPSSLTNFVVSASPGVEEATVGDVPMIFMTYATPLGAENGTGAQPAYVRAVLADVSRLRTAGKAQGSLIYCLNLWGVEVEESDSQNYEVVQQTYRQWRRGG